jgi:hypothetical protein
MDHHDQNHKHHQKERDQEKKDQKTREEEGERSALPFHPAWFVVIGIVLIVLVVCVWIFMTVP